MNPFVGWGGVDCVPSAVAANRFVPKEIPIRVKTPAVIVFSIHVTRKMNTSAPATRNVQSAICVRAKLYAFCPAAGAGNVPMSRRMSEVLAYRTNRMTAKRNKTAQQANNQTLRRLNPIVASLGQGRPLSVPTDTLTGRSSQGCSSKRIHGSFVSDLAAN